MSTPASLVRTETGGEGERVELQGFAIRLVDEVSTFVTATGWLRLLPRVQLVSASSTGIQLSRSKLASPIGQQPGRLNADGAVLTWKCAWWYWISWRTIKLAVGA